MSRCRKRSAARRRRRLSGRISSLRTSEPRGLARRGERRPASSSTDPRGRPCPRRRRARSPRAPRVESIETRGEERLDRRGTGTVEVTRSAQRPSSRTRRPSSMSIESISSTKSGLPSAASTIRASTSRRVRLRRRGSRPASRTRVGERLEEDRRRVHLAAAPARTDVEQLRPGHAEEQDRAPRATSPRGTRRDRGRSPRPSGCRRRRRRVADGSPGASKNRRTAPKPSSTPADASVRPMISATRRPRACVVRLRRELDESRPWPRDAPASSRPATSLTASSTART